MSKLAHSSDYMDQIEADHLRREGDNTVTFMGCQVEVVDTPQRLLERSDRRMETYHKVAIQGLRDRADRHLTITDWERALEHVKETRNANV
jgi:hypothetical protein